MSVWKIKTDIITSIAVSPRHSKLALLFLSIICEIKKVEGTNYSTTIPVCQDKFS